MRNSIQLTTEKKTTKEGVVFYWALRWIGQDGKQHSKGLGRCDKVSERTAKKMLREKEIEFDKNPGRRNASRSMSVKDFTDKYFEAKRGELKQGTLLKYQEAVSYLTEFFGEHKTIETFTKYDAEIFKTAMQTGKLAKRKKVVKEKGKTIQTDEKKAMSPESINMHLRSVKAIFNWGVEFDFLVANPFRKSVMTIKNCSGWKYVSQKEFSDLLEKASPKMALLMSLCRLAGLRHGEAVHLEWVDVDFEKNHINITGKPDWTPKDSEIRTIPLCPELSEMLLRAYDTAPEGTKKVLYDVSHNNILRGIRSIVKRSGVSNYGKPLHTLRKSAITDWAGRYSMYVVKEWAGHASISTTEKFYTKVSNADYSKAAIESFWKKEVVSENVSENGKKTENAVSTGNQE